MPLYTFGCQDCGASREVLIDLKAAQDMELICTACGGAMLRRPVLSINIVGEAIVARRQVREAEAEKMFRKACGHSHQCRCAVRLKRPNPFSQEIRKAAGFVDDE